MLRRFRSNPLAAPLLGLPYVGYLFSLLRIIIGIDFYLSKTSMILTNALLLFSASQQQDIFCTPHFQASQTSTKGNEGGREILVQAARLQQQRQWPILAWKRGVWEHIMIGQEKLKNAVGSTRTNQSTGPTTSTLHRLLESPESRLAYRSTLVSSVWDPHHPHWSHFTHLTNFYRQHQSHPPSLGFPRTVKSLGGTSHLMRY